MSVENLAARLDTLDADGAFIFEDKRIVSVSNLGVDTTREVFDLTFTIGWSAHIFDGANTEWEIENIDEVYAPFRIDINKPVTEDGILRLLTNVGFKSWLEREDGDELYWQVARLKRNIVTISVCFSPWDTTAPTFNGAPSVCSPRTLVREFSNQRVVPTNLDRWLLQDSNDFTLDDPCAVIWAEQSSRMLILALPDEYDDEQRKLRFKGPPRLELTYPSPEKSVATSMGNDAFKTLQCALAWTYEVERESEMRHILLATELARCGGMGEETSRFLRDYLEAALEGAKTAYQLQLAGISSDALKTLTELRKSVTDETAKISDATRQIITAVASAFAVGTGAVAARLTTKASPWLILLVMVMACAYVAITILSGVMFTFLQRKVRKEWQPRLYRFLSKPDYEALVDQPTHLAEKTLWWASGISAVALVAGTLALIVFIFHRPSTHDTTTKEVLPPLSAPSITTEDNKFQKNINKKPDTDLQTDRTDKENIDKK